MDPGKISSGSKCYDNSTCLVSAPSDDTRRSRDPDLPGYMHSTQQQKNRQSPTTTRSLQPQKRVSRPKTYPGLQPDQRDPLSSTQEANHVGSTNVYSSHGENNGCRREVFRKQRRNQNDEQMSATDHVQITTCSQISSQTCDNCPWRNVYHRKKVFQKQKPSQNHNQSSASARGLIVTLEGSEGVTVLLQPFRRSMVTPSTYLEAE